MQDNMLNLKIGICNGSTETENFIERMVCKKRKMSGITIQINIFSLKDLIRNNINECDIIFLDLKSEEDIARAVAAHNKSKQKKILIAIAADDGHAQELIELEVFRLLVKPLNEVMFDKYFYEALSKFPIISKVYNFQYNRIQYKILLNEIIYFQSDKRITYIITNNKINKISGVAHFVMNSEVECYDAIRKLLKLIPHNNECTYKFELNSNLKKNKNIKGLVPQNKRLPYDVKKIIYEICDEGSFIEIQEQYAPNIIVGMGKVNNGTVGIIANQPMIKAGVLDADSSVKAARFIRYCDCYNIPIITLVDTPGFMPSENEEKKGIIRHGAKLVTAYAEAHIPKITVILRKAYGGAYIAMGSKHLGTDFVFSWPNAEIAVMGAEGAIDILYQKELRSICDEKEKDIFKKSKIKEYNNRYINSHMALAEGYVDAEVDPDETVIRIADALKTISKKEFIDSIIKKHTNIPL